MSRYSCWKLLPGKVARGLIINKVYPSKNKESKGKNNWSNILCESIRLFRYNFYLVPVLSLEYIFVIVQWRNSINSKRYC
jgi:hypothetical protein